MVSLIPSVSTETNDITSKRRCDKFEKFVAINVRARAARIVLRLGSSRRENYTKRGWIIVNFLSAFSRQREIQSSICALEGRNGILDLIISLRRTMRRRTKNATYHPTVNFTMVRVHRPRRFIDASLAPDSFLSRPMRVVAASERKAVRINRAIHSAIRPFVSPVAAISLAERKRRKV